MKLPLPCRSAWRAAGVLALVALTPGCQALGNWFFGKHEAPRLLSLHTFSWEPPAGKADCVYVEYQGRLMYVEASPVLGTGDFTKIEAFDVPGGRGLRLHLNERGRHRWLQATGLNRGRELVGLLDNQYRGGYRVTVPDDSAVVSLAGPFSPAEAVDILAKHNPQR